MRVGHRKGYFYIGMLFAVGRSFVYLSGIWALGLATLFAEPANARAARSGPTPTCAHQTCRRLPDNVARPPASKTSGGPSSAVPYGANRR